MKACKGCGQSLPNESFGKHSQSKDGLRPRCRPCTNESNRKSLANRALVGGGPPVASKSCTVCQKKKSADAFYSRAEAPWLLRSVCVECISANRDAEAAKNYAAIYREKHSDKIRAYNADRRAKEPYGAVKHETLKSKWFYWGGVCYLCKKAIDDDLAWDHVKPLSRGGLHTLANLRPTHASCNSKKRTKWYGVESLDRLCL